MARSIATKTGDDGTTSLLFGERVPKHHSQIEAVGAFDELNVALGLAKIHLTSDGGAKAERFNLVTRTQKNLVAIMGELACPEAQMARYTAGPFAKFETMEIAVLDETVAALEGRGLNFDGWATPGSNASSAAFELARVTARRAERRLSALSTSGKTVRPELFRYVNRLSDVLWLLAREAEQ